MTYARCARVGSVLRGSLRRLSVGASAAALVLACATRTPAASESTPAQPAPVLGSATPENVVENAEPKLSGRVSRELYATARAQGSVRVLVHLNVNVQPDARLDTPVVQRRTIEAAQEQLLDALDAAVPNVRPSHRAVRRLTTTPFLVLTVTEAELRALDDPAMDRVVRSVVADATMVPLLHPTAPAPVPIDLSTRRVRADEAAAVQCLGDSQVVVVIDTGVDDSLPILQGRVLSGSSTGEAQPDGELGWNQGTCGDSIYGRPLGGGFGHGSQVASVVTCNATGASGVAPGARLISIRVTDASGTASAGDVAKALEETYLIWSRCYSIASVCLSLAKLNVTYPTEQACEADPEGAAIAAAVANLYSLGIPVVCGSGNDWSRNALAFPACLPKIVSVAATERDDTFASYSNAADFLDLLAPGSGLRATNLDGSMLRIDSGTSIAGPHVAAAIAVLRQFRPHEDIRVVLEALVSTGLEVQVPDNAPKRRLDVFEALQELAGSPRPQCGGGT